MPSKACMTRSNAFSAETRMNGQETRAEESYVQESLGYAPASGIVRNMFNAGCKQRQFGQVESFLKCFDHQGFTGVRSFITSMIDQVRNVAVLLLSPYSAGTTRNWGVSTTVQSNFIFLSLPSYIIRICHFFPPPGLRVTDKTH